MTADAMGDDEFDEYLRICDGLRGHRWPWTELGEALGGSLRTQADRLAVDSAQVCRWKREGLTDAMADRCAIRAGLHPRAVWDAWDQVGQAREERLPLSA